MPFESFESLEDTLLAPAGIRHLVGERVAGPNRRTNAGCRYEVSGVLASIELPLQVEDPLAMWLIWPIGLVSLEGETSQSALVAAFSTTKNQSRWHDGSPHLGAGVTLYAIDFK